MTDLRDATRFRAEYLEDKIEQNEIDVNKMLDKLHYYVSIPNAEGDRQVSSSGSIRYVKYQYENLKKVVKYMRKNGFKSTFIKIKNKVLK